MKRRFHMIHALICLLVLVIVSIPFNPAERNNSAISLYDQGNYEAAIDAYQAAAVNMPDAPEPYYNSASALAATGRLRAAEAALQEALDHLDEDSGPQAEPLVQQAYYNLGNIYYEQALYEDAVTAYREVLKRNPQNEAARHNYELALLHFEPSPTPTTQEQNTNPDEDQVNPEATPTPNPMGEDESQPPTPTPSPPPTQAAAPPDNATPTLAPAEGGTQGPLPSTPSTPSAGPSLDDVERQLDAIQANQRTLSEMLNELATPGPFNSRDW